MARFRIGNAGDMASPGKRSILMMTVHEQKPLEDGRGIGARQVVKKEGYRGIGIGCDELRTFFWGGKNFHFLIDEQHSAPLFPITVCGRGKINE